MGHKVLLHHVPIRKGSQQCNCHKNSRYLHLRTKKTQNTQNKSLKKKGEKEKREKQKGKKNSQNQKKNEKKSLFYFQTVCEKEIIKNLLLNF